MPVVPATNANGLQKAPQISQNNKPEGEEMNREQLIKLVFNQSANKFKYEIALQNNFPKVIYKERYFKYFFLLIEKYSISFEIALLDINTKQKVRNMNRIPLDVAIYTSETPPKLIKNNTIGFSEIKIFFIIIKRK